jgi:hypothetical protein
MFKKKDNLMKITLEDQKSKKQTKLEFKNIKIMREDSNVICEVFFLLNDEEINVREHITNKSLLTILAKI